MGAYVLKDVFNWIEVKKQTLFFDVMQHFVLTQVQQKLYASWHIVVWRKIVILTGILQAAMIGDF